MRTVVTPPAAQPVSVGEEIRYELRAILPIAELRNFIIRDQLPVGVRCAEAPAVDLGPTGPHALAGFVPGGVITPTCTDTLVQWNFGTQALTNGASISFYDFAVNFVGRVENTANTNDGNVLANGAAPSVVAASYTNSLGTLVTLPIGSVNVQVQEPRIVLTQAIASATADAADQLTVTVTATNTGTGTAYNLRVLNDLTTLGKLSYVGSGIGGLDPPDVVDVATLGANRPIFIWNPANPKYAIAPGASRSFTFRVSVNIGVQPLEVIANTLQAKWDSLPGRSTALNSSGTDRRRRQRDRPTQGRIAQCRPAAQRLRNQRRRQLLGARRHDEQDGPDAGRRASRRCLQELPGRHQSARGHDPERRCSATTWRSAA